jgi:hypothetical protein
MFPSHYIRQVGKKSWEMIRIYIELINWWSAVSQWMLVLYGLLNWYPITFIFSLSFIPGCWGWVVLIVGTFWKLSPILVLCWRLIFGWYEASICVVVLRLVQKGWYYLRAPYHARIVSAWYQHSLLGPCYRRFVLPQVPIMLVVEGWYCLSLISTLVGSLVPVLLLYIGISQLVCFRLFDAVPNGAPSISWLHCGRPKTKLAW